MTTPSTRVLVVDDEPLARERLRTLLQEEPGFDVVGEAGDGITGAESIMALSPDLVFLDVQMPEMDGFEATAAIRRMERDTGRRVRIVAMTAHAMSGDRKRCLGAGMDDYVAKPISVKEIDRILVQVAHSRTISSPNAA